MYASSSTAVLARLRTSPLESEVWPNISGQACFHLNIAAKPRSCVSLGWAGLDDEVAMALARGHIQMLASFALRRIIGLKAAVSLPLNPLKRAFYVSSNCWPQMRSLERE